MKNYKTTLAGIGMICTGIGLITQHKVTEGIGCMVAGFGLIAAKDAGVTGAGL